MMTDYEKRIYQTSEEAFPLNITSDNPNFHNGIGRFNIDKVCEDVRSYNIGESNYSKHKIQPWDIWEEYELNPWDADIVKRVLRTKKGNDRVMDYEKIIHICKERIRQLKDKR